MLQFCYEGLLRDPVPRIDELLAFCGVPADAGEVFRLAARIVPPESPGRGHGRAAEAGFDAADLTYLRNLGYAT